MLFILIVRYTKPILLKIPSYELQAPKCLILRQRSENLIIRLKLLRSHHEFLLSWLLWDFIAFKNIEVLWLGLNKQIFKGCC
jgi:hypothetical protein